MDSPELHEIAEKKAKLSLEVSSFRRELDALVSERESFLVERREEALRVVGSVMEAAHKLLSEASETAQGVDGYLSALKDATAALYEAREGFRGWRETEETRLKALAKEAETKASEMQAQAAILSEERMKLKAAWRDLGLMSEQARKDEQDAKAERRKLMENKKFMDETYGRSIKGQ